MLTPELLPTLSELLRSGQRPLSLAEDQLRLLMLKGALFTLQQEGSSAAVNLLETAATASPEAEIRDSALLALADLASHGNTWASEAIFNLEIEYNHPMASDLVRSYTLVPNDPTRHAIHHLLNKQSDLLAACDPELELISNFFLQAKPDVQQRILQAATQSGLQHWAAIISTVSEPTETRLQNLLETFGSFQGQTRRMARRELAKLAQQGSIPAQDLICRLYLRYDDQSARQTALEAGYTPVNRTEQALFYFFTEQWDASEQLDFDHTLINIAFDTASPEMRRRIMAHSRYTGQADWLKAPTGRLRARLISELSGADWQNATQNLWNLNQEEDLWRLAQIAPPRWSADILTRLFKSGWLPGNPDEAQAFKQLVELAADCGSRIPEIQPRQQMQVMLADTTCLAFHPESQQMALGGSENTLVILTPPNYEDRFKPLTIPAAQTRALRFSPDGQYLACAGGDHKIRAIQVQDRKMVKTLEGHSGMIRALEFSPDGRVLYSAGFDGSIRAWRFPQGPELRTLARQQSEIFGMAVANQGKHLLNAGTDGRVTVRSLPAGDVVRQLPAQADTLMLLSAAEGELVTAYCRNQFIHLWNISSSRLIVSIPAGGSVSALSLSADELSISAGFLDGSLAVWDTSSGDLLARLKGHNRPITGLAQNRDGSQIFSASQDSRLCAWNSATLALIQRPIGALPPGAIQTIETRYKSEKMSESERSWLNFISALASYQARFDIEVAEPGIFSAGEFDIHL